MSRPDPQLCSSWDHVLPKGTGSLTTREDLFLTICCREIDHFVTHTPLNNSILLFPPLESRHRFLLHQLVLGHNFGPEIDLTSVSMGHQQDRRTMIGCPVTVDKVHQDETLLDQFVKLNPFSPLCSNSSPSPSPSSSSPTASSSNTKPNVEEEEEEEEEEETWDQIYDDDGECVKKSPSPSGINVVHASEEVVTLGDKRDLELPHVMEISHFASDMKTTDLFARLHQAGNSDFEIVWVDDTHALAVFRNESEATKAWKQPMAEMRLCPMSSATSESRRKARTSMEKLLPFKKRPQTSVNLARRFIGHHLGVKVQVSQEQLQKEKRLLQEAKDRKRAGAKKNTDDAWEGK